MILILSDSADVITLKVCRWLDKQNCDYYVVTEKDVFTIKHIDSKNVILAHKTTNKVVDLSIITAYWYRRGQFYSSIKLIKNKSEIAQKLNQYFSWEQNDILNFVGKNKNRVFLI